MAGTPRFGRVLTAMVTPFKADGSFDPDGAAELARWLVANGSDGLVVAGTTGEAPTLKVDEHIELWKVVREAVDVPLVAGTGSNDTSHACMMTAKAAEVGMDGALVVTPYYNRPSQAGLDLHFREVARAAELPIVLYDIPGRSGRKIDTDLLIRLGNEVENIVGLKDAAGNPAETAKVVARTPADFEVLSGDDALTLPLLAIGAVGVIGTTTHWAGRQMGELIAAFDAGDVARAREINQSLLESYWYPSRETAQYALAVKVALRVLGQPAGPVRPPLGPEPAELEGEARAMLDRLGLLG
ncbi:MAG TPA: 4-hydroxy-tetrahydrodipicolinate synthase [Acidimicrobiales bacterium]|nr:4-hydroxy-tetrahydrodipicolinate synthase [Acidimicrobiales bacterium]